MSTSMSRRRFVSDTSRVVATAATLAELLMVSGCARTPEQLLEGHTRRLLKANPSTAELARLWLEHHPEEQHVEELSRTLLEALPYGDLERKMFPFYLRAAVQRDFRQDNLLHHDGWTLSHTEMRLYTLVHLLAR